MRGFELQNLLWIQYFRKIEVLSHTCYRIILYSVQVSWFSYLTAHTHSHTHRHARFMVKFTVDFMPTSVQSWYNGRRKRRAKHKMNPDQTTPLRSRIEYSHHIQKHERRHTKIRKNFNCNFIVYVPFRFLLAIFLLVLCYCSLYTISLFTSSHFLWF